MSPSVRSKGFFLLLGFLCVIVRFLHYKFKHLEANVVVIWMHSFHEEISGVIHILNKYIYLNKYCYCSYRLLILIHLMKYLIHFAVPGKYILTDFDSYCRTYLNIFIITKQFTKKIVVLSLSLELFLKYLTNWYWTDALWLCHMWERVCFLKTDLNSEAS